MAWTTSTSVSSACSCSISPILFILSIKWGPQTLFFLPQRWLWNSSEMCKESAYNWQTYLQREDILGLPLYGRDFRPLTWMTGGQVPNSVRKMPTKIHRALGTWQFLLSVQILTWVRSTRLLGQQTRQNKFQHFKKKYGTTSSFPLPSGSGGSSCQPRPLTSTYQKIKEKVPGAQRGISCLIVPIAYPLARLAS